ncbi:MAG: hypothetical protein DELT_02528 [Desulfovibrio sp.]
MSNEALSKWVCIARTGTFADSKGRPHTFTESDFDQLKAGYNPESTRAALCFGHPQDSDPAFGWIQNLKREGQKFFAQFARVPAEVKKLVDDGRYENVSMSLSPDKKRILHVGLLGASAPAMDGLGPVSFEAEGITINFTAPEPEAENNGGSMNPEELQKQIIALQQQVAALTAENEKLKGEKGEADKGKEEADAKAAQVAAEFSAYKGQIATSKREERVRALVNSGKLEPAKEKETVSFAAALGKVEDMVNFSAADGKTEEITAEERYFRELEARTPAALSLDFSAMAPAPAHAANAAPVYDPTEITSKL